MLRRLAQVLLCGAIAHHLVEATVRKPVKGDASSHQVALKTSQADDVGKQNATKVAPKAKVVTAEKQAKSAAHGKANAEKTEKHAKGAPHGTASDNLIMAYGAALIAMVGIVTVMFYPMGAAVVVQVVLYVSCLAFVKIALKLCYEQDFNYPKFITAVHLLISSSAAFVVLLYRRFANGKPIAVPTSSELFLGILPIACTFGCSIASENSALVFVSAAFSEVIAATNPVMSFCLTWVFGLGSDLRLLLPIGVVVMGCMISVNGEIYFSAMGLALLLLSVFFRGLKAVMQQKLMSGETKEKFDPVTLMAWMCMYAFIVVGTYSVATEGAAPMNAIRSSQNLPSLMAPLFGSAAIACTLNISALFVIRQLGAVGMQLVSQMKSILVVIGGIALLGESFTNPQKLGFGIVLTGVYWYSRMMRSLSPGAKGH
eukprot:TRINITY_DN188_c0_g1_i3.p1 TRINITY_DN188_c0_g1~~TRINITY_DN188_c0_g1_i3.p1  ORF type:complete len:428 (-),score=84.35 TRINITY_DN188_c0_g1_i3:233-1516(-)